MSWYAINTKPHQERVAEQNLQRLEVETFCPMIQERKIIRRKNRVLTSPLFPGYLFANFSLQRQYRSVVYARGVKKVIAFGSIPAVVDKALIDAIRNRLQDGCFMSSNAEFKPGQLVRIQEGPLHGLEAIFEKEMTGSQRAVLLLRALSYQARVVVDLGQIVNL